MFFLFLPVSFSNFFLLFNSSSDGSFSRESSSNLREDNSSRGGNGFDRGYGPVVRNTPGAPYGTVYSRESGENRGKFCSFELVSF